MVFNRENAIGLVLLLLCGVVALVLLYSIATGTRFRFDGPSWVGTALVILFIVGTTGHGLGGRVRIRINRTPCRH